MHGETNEYSIETNRCDCLDTDVCGSCLKAIRRLQRFGHLPSDASVFKSYAVEGNFSDVRLAALEALVDFTAGLFLYCTCIIRFLS